jgi:octaprenyl-diphosphate synthase
MNNLKNIYAPIAADLAGVESEIKSQMSVLTGGHRFVDEIVRFFFDSGGQRLRPALVILSARAAYEDEKKRFGAPTSTSATRDFPSDEVVTLAALVEYIHAASLIHDDVVDCAVARRGRESVNARFGNKISVLAGDMLYSHAFKMLTDGFDKSVMKIFSLCVQKMCRGEINALKECDFGGYLGVIEDKTAVFMSACCEAGAAVALGNPSGSAAVEAFADFGLNLGMIYQIADDLSDRDAPVPLDGECRGRLAAKLKESVASARMSIGSMSDSAYRQSMIGLLEYIIGQRREISNAVGGNQ